MPVLDDKSVEKPALELSRESLLKVGFEAQRRGDFRAAESCYLRVLEEDPFDGEALYLQGFLCHQQKDEERALPYMLEAVAQRPQEPLFLKGLGDVLLGTGQSDRARECYARALSVDPGFTDSLNALGNLAAREKNLEEAVQWFRKAVDRNPQSAPALLGLGCALRDLGNLDGAERCLTISMTLKPRSPDAITALGEVKMKKGLFAEAEELFRRSLEHCPSNPQVLNNLGSALKEQGRIAEAIQIYLDAYSREPTEAAIPFNLGGATSALGKIAEAIRWYDRATELNPEYAEAHANKSLLLLASGDFQRGWEEYRWRFKISDVRQRVDTRTFPVPEWHGEPFEGKTLLVRSEQGAGDMIQFVRYLPLVKSRGGRVILETHRRLARLLKNISGVDAMVTVAETQKTEFDLWVPLLSIPRYFTDSLESIPSPGPYLAPEPELIASTKALIGGDGLKVGLCWQGNKEYVGDHDRSMALSTLAPLLNIQDVHFYSLQKGEGAQQILQLPSAMSIEDIGSRLDCGHDAFVETAAFMTHLDLVISTDTSIPHLAGAMGRPVWLLLSASPEWRWFREGEASPWYPSMKLFRRDAGEHWGGLLERVAAALALVAADHREKHR